MKSICFLILCVYLSLGTEAQRQRTKLSGKITDARTGEALAGASILLSDSRTGTITDSTGHYVFNNIPVGHTIMEISHTGYRTIVEHIDISTNDVHDFVLESSFLKNEGVTITAVANATSIRKAPIPISRLNRMELMATTSTNIIDALSRQPGISQLSTGPAISKPIIRGLGYNRLVVINDGIRQEGQQWGDEHGIEIDEQSVNRVEIVKGPASLIYGSDAMAGVINIITTVPPPVNTIRGSVLSGYQTNNRQRTLFANVGGHKNGFNWNGWGALKAASDYKNRYDGYVFNSKFNEKNFGGYAGYNGTWGFTHLILSSFNQEAGMIEGERDALGRFVKPVAGGTVVMADDDDFKSIEPQIPYQHIQHLKLVLDNSFRLKKGRLTLNTGWQRNQRKEYGDPGEPGKADLYFDLQSINYNTAYHFDHRSGWNTSVGINGMFQQNTNKGEEVLIPEYSIFDIGSFVYTSKSVGKTTFSGGLRFDNRALRSDSYTENGEQKFIAFNKNFSNISASAGVSIAATELSVWKFNLARGFRAPSIPELASNGAHEGTNRYEYGDNRLHSEKSLQADLGWEANSDHISAAASLFFNSINNFIFYTKLAGVNSADSLVEVDGEFIPAFRFGQQDASLYGIEFMVDLHPHPFDWLHWQNTFSFVRGKFADPIEGINNLPLIPAPRWINELRAELLPSGKLIKNLVLHFEADHFFRQSKPFSAFETETATPAYTLFNAGISMAFQRRKRDLFHLYLNAINIGDVAYQNHLSRLKYAGENQASGRRGVYNSGRNFSIKLNIPFSL